MRVRVYIYVIMDYIARSYRLIWVMARAIAAVRFTASV